MRYTNVNRYTRAGKSGKLIRCPHCKVPVRVYNFGWTRIPCFSCQVIGSVAKNDWLLLIDKGDKNVR